MSGAKRRRLPGLTVNRLIPNALTLLGLCAGMTAIRLALMERWDLAIAAVLVAIVGSVALSGTLGINALERRREIGVMRAIGASGRAIGLQLVYRFSPVGVVVWFVVVAVLAVLASGLPAWRATRVRVREVLAYE